MFHFPTFPSYNYGFIARSQVLRLRGSPIRISPDIALIYSSPRLFAVSHVLLRLLMPRHSPYALFACSSLLNCFEIIVSYNEKAFSLFSPYTSVFGSIVVYPRSWKDLSLQKIFLISYYLFVSFFIRFSMIFGLCPVSSETVPRLFRLYRLILSDVSIFQRRRQPAYHSTLRSNITLP